MAEEDLIWMSVVVFLPSVFALGLLFFPSGKERAMCWWSLAGTALTLGVSIGMFINFRFDTVVENPTLAPLASRALIADGVLPTPGSANEPAVLAAQAAKTSKSKDWVARYPWIERFNIDYYLGADGISMPLVLLTTALCFLAMIASFGIKRYESTERFVRGYCILFLVLETGMLGTFLALDFFLFYIFWEVMLLPMYFLIGVWGGPRREYAAIKFFLYTLAGSVLILIALLGFYFTNVRDFVGAERLDREASHSDIASVKTAWSAHAAAQKDVNLKLANLSKLEEAIKSGEKKGAAKTEIASTSTELLEAKTAERKTATALDEAKQEIVVNSFDLVVLARVGRAALQFLSAPTGTLPTDVPALTTVNAAIKAAAERSAAAKKEADKAREDLNRATKATDKALAEIALVRAQVAVADAGADEVRSKANLEGTRKGLAKRFEQAFFTPAFQYTMFVLLFIGFAIKVPVFPFHTWLPDAHVEAPTPISMILAGVLLKLGGYGILRIAYPICPWAAQQLALWVALFGVINIVYGAFAAMAQTDFKKLVAYSSVSHMGYVILGIAVWATGPENRPYWSWGMNGAMFQMIAHGITSAGMFFCVGVIYDRAHHRNLDNFRGLYEPMPLYGGISAVIFFAAMGLPGMCGFVGEFMVVLSAWGFAPEGAVWAGRLFSILSAATVVLTAAYILWTLQRVFMGTNPAYKNYPDITVPELSCIVPLVVLSVLLGIAPALLLNWMEPSVTNLVDTLASLK